MGYNNGDYNSGNYNNGKRNGGDYNKGDYNFGDYNFGCLNIMKRTIKIFDKPSDWTFEDWWESGARNILDRIGHSQEEWEKLSDDDKKVILEIPNFDAEKFKMITGIDVGADIVNHPKHYNIPGRKECIEEMIDKFGAEKVKSFCELNAYKYEYRHELKNGDEDLKKAEWYRKKIEELGGTK